MVMGTVYVDCEEDTCAFNNSGRCIAKRISIVVEARMDDLDELVCDTYEHTDDWYDDGDNGDGDQLLVDDPLEGWY